MCANDGPLACTAIGVDAKGFSRRDDQGQRGLRQGLARILSEARDAVGIHWAQWIGQDAGDRPRAGADAEPVAPRPARGPATAPGRARGAPAVAADAADADAADAAVYHIGRSAVFGNGQLAEGTIFNLRVEDE